MSWTSPNPYGGLEPSPAGGRPLYPAVGTLGALWRGARKRCPRCASGYLFVTWFKLRSACPRCELRFEREEGGFLGAMVLNYMLAVGLWLVALAIALVLTVPDVPVLPLLGMSAVILVVLPLWFYPRSKTIWAAVEYLVARNDPDYRAPVARDPRARDLE
jgi:uncharacterized protein (DUF983 family)